MNIGLSKGMRVDRVILLGSALDNDSRLNLHFVNEYLLNTFSFNDKVTLQPIESDANHCLGKAGKVLLD